MHGNSTDGIKQLIILNVELETNVEVLKGAKEYGRKRQRQAALPENESNHRLVEWQEKNTQIKSSPAAVCLKPKLTDNDALFRGNVELIQTNQRLQIKIDELRE
uniref:Uncharacterized protein n=1 Tax=Onchocerca volvulus TaxID=6282 RepID=A0A8R1XPW6_ONCVO